MTTRLQTLAATAAILALLAAAAMAGPGQDRQMRTSTALEAWQDAQRSFRPQLHEADDLVGAEVVNRQGEELGEIEEIVLDPNRHTISYAVLEFGGFLGLGKDLHAIPWGAFDVRTDDDGKPEVVLNVREEQLANAKGFDDDDWPDVGDERWTRSVFASFNTTEDADLQWRREHVDWSSYNIPKYDEVAIEDDEKPRRTQRSWRGPDDLNAPIYDKAGDVTQRDRRDEWARDEWNTRDAPRYDSVETRRDRDRMARRDRDQRDRDENLWMLEDDDYEYERMRDERRARDRMTAQRDMRRQTERRYAGRDWQDQRRTEDAEKRKLSDLMDVDVVNQGEDVGEVKNIIVDTHAGALAYVVVDVDGDYADDHWDRDTDEIAIPWHAVNIRNDELRLNVQHSALSGLKFDGDLASLEQTRKAIEMHDRAACPTYWEVVYIVPTATSTSTGGNWR